MLIILLLMLGLAVLIYGAALLRAVRASRVAPRPEAVALGAVVNFFDALGIGSFAPTTAWFKFRRMVPDRLIPPTLLVGLTAGAMAEGFIFMAGVRVDPVLLFGCALAVLFGGLVGAPLVARARVWLVQLVVALGLLVAAMAYVLYNLDRFPPGGAATGLPPLLTLIAIIANFGFGILANFGVGNYAPTMAMFSLMGMNPIVCFPIMAAGGAFMGAGASLRHLAIGEIDLRVVIGLALGGIPAVFVAAFLVVAMPLETLRWLVLVVVLYTAMVMGAAALRGRREGRAGPGTAPLASEVEAEA